MSDERDLMARPLDHIGQSAGSISTVGEAGEQARSAASKHEAEFKEW